MSKRRTWKLFAIHATLNLVENVEHLNDGIPVDPDELPSKPYYEPTPNDPPWGSGIAIGLWIFSVFLIVILPSFFLVAYSATLNPPIRETAALVEFAKSDPTAILVQILAIVPAHILTLIAAWLIVTRYGTFSFRKTLGMNSGGIRPWHYLAILIGIIGISILVSYFFPEKDNDLLRMIKSSRSGAVLLAILATFTAPVVEEVIYRGVLYSAFQRTINVPAAFLLVTLLFSVVHVPQYYPSFSTIFLLATLSVTLTALRVFSKNLLPCIILHTLFNGLQSILIVFGPSPDTSDPTAFLTGIFK